VSVEAGQPVVAVMEEQSAVVFVLRMAVVVVLRTVAAVV